MKKSSRARAAIAPRSRETRMALPAAVAEIARCIDHTLLKPEAFRADLLRLCDEGIRYGFASVCVNPANTAVVARQLRGTGVKVCTVAGFPLGATLPEAKAAEAAAGIRAGAQEIDMVLHVGAVKSGDWKAVAADIAGVVAVCHRRGVLCKVILEMVLLTQEEKRRACLIAKRAGADFVKTSTGFGAGGATPEDVRLMRKTVGRRMGVKASGGIRSLEDFRKMTAAGATRIGTSAGVKIIGEALAELLPGAPRQ